MVRCVVRGPSERVLHRNAGRRLCGSLQGAGDFAYGNDGHDSSRGNRDGDSLGEDEIAKPLIFNAET
jgi:hypothetical protein